MNPNNGHTSLWVKVCALSVVLSLALGFPVASAETAAAGTSKNEPIKIGFIVPLSGASAFQGHGLLNGVNLFLEQHNNQIAGRKVQLIVENDGSSVATAVAKAYKLANEDHCQVITGVLLSNVGDALAAVADKLKTPIVIGVAGGDEITQRKREKYVIRIAPSCSQTTLPFGEYCYKKLGYRRVVTFAMDYVFGWDHVSGFQQSFEQAGGKVVQKVWAPLGLLDFSDYIKKIRHDADAVFMLNVGGAVQIVPKQYQEFGPKLPIIGGGTTTDEVLLDRVGDPLLGAVTCAPYSPEINTPENKKFVKAYTERFGAKPSFYADGSYTCCLLIQKGAEAIKGDVENGDKFMAAMQGAKLEAPRGTITFDNHNQAVMNVYFRKVEKVNGHLQNTVIDVIPHSSQFWKYNPEQYMKEPPHSRDYPPCKFCSQ